MSNVDVKFKFGLRGVSVKSLFFGSLMSVLLLFSLFSCVLVVGAVDSLEVGDEAELVAAVDGVVSGVPVVIALNDDIVLSESLSISEGKNVTLVSVGDGEFSLVGADGVSTIVVEGGGELRLDGIVVTHADADSGCGVNVTSGGLLIMYSGMIFNNDDVLDGGGVVNYGNFTLSGGIIYNNTCVENGGGVVNYGNFTLSGGEIFDNAPCGVFDSGNFTMSGGKIFSNIGSGVTIYSGGNFTMSGGEIYKNAADIGGGVYINSNYGAGNFIMSGGMIYNNTALEFGGGVYNEGSFFRFTRGMISNNTAVSGGGVYTNGDFTLSGGEISNNTAGSGGGVYNNLGNFTMSDGELFNNTATSNGGGAYSYGGNFTMSGGKISSNTALNNGGGIGVPGIAGLEYVYIQDDAVFSNNWASKSYDRASIHDDLYDSRISRRATWTSPFKQGYNNYDILYVNSLDGENGNPGTKTPSPSGNTSNPPNSRTPSPTNTPGPDDDGYNFWRLVIVLTIIVGLVAAVLFFYLPNRKTQPVAEDWIDSTTA